MDDKDFDKLFSDKLKDGLPYTSNDRSWDELADQLDAHDRDNKQVVGGAWWQNKNLLWLAPLFLATVGGIWWALTSTSNKSNQNTVLINELQQVKTLLEQKDTVYIEKVIYKTDTVVRYKYLSQPRQTDNKLPNDSNIFAPKPTKVNADSPQSNLQTPQFLRIKNLNINKGKPDFTVSKSRSDDFLTKTDTSFLYQNSETKQQVKPEITSKSPVFSEKMGAPKQELTEKSTVDSVSKITDSAPVSPQIETKTTKQARFFIGVNAGAQFLATPQCQGIKNGSFQYGVRIEAALSDAWRVQLGGNYARLDIETSQLDDRYNLPAMPAQFQNDDYAMQAVTAVQPQWQAYLGVKYMMGKKRLRPFVGVAYAMTYVGQHDALYHVHNRRSGSQEVGSSLHPGVTLYNLMQLTGGFELKLNRFLSFQTEGFFNKDLNKTAKSCDNFGVRGGLFFRF